MRAGAKPARPAFAVVASSVVTDAASRNSVPRLAASCCAHSELHHPTATATLPRMPDWPAAVLFDFDGVIVNSEPVHLRAFQHAAAGEGIELTSDEYYRELIG